MDRSNSNYSIFQPFRWSIVFAVVTVAALVVLQFFGPVFQQATLAAAEAEPEANLYASYKAPSSRTLAPGETLNFNIYLYNSGAETAVATVVDPLPEELALVDGTITGGGVFADGVITWTDIEIEPNASVSLMFEVTPVAAEITDPVQVVNVATITSETVEFTRKATIVLVPEPATEDDTPPVLESIQIGDQDVLESPEVVLHIAASDDTGVEWMYLREWQLTGSRFPRWEIVQSSGWVPYQADYEWTLGSQDGVHYVGVWVADAGYNASLLNRQALDFASLAQPGAQVSQNGRVPYMVYYDEGVDVTADLLLASGDADLYVWFPTHFRVPNLTSTNQGDGIDEQLSFTTPEAGAYIFMVHGFTEAMYELNIQPAGGAGTLAATLLNQVQTDAPELARPPVFTIEPNLTVSGLSPLGTAQSAVGPYQVYTPLVQNR